MKKDESIGGVFLPEGVCLPWSGGGGGGFEEGGGWGGVEG